MRAPPRSLECRENPHLSLRNTREVPVFRNKLPTEPDCRECHPQYCRAALLPFSLWGGLAVRFQRLQQANAMRSQTDDQAKGGLDDVATATALNLSFSPSGRTKISVARIVLHTRNEQRNADRGRNTQNGTPKGKKAARTLHRDSQQRTIFRNRTYSCPCVHKASCYA